MRIILIHQNFPGQFKHLALKLSQDPSHQVMAICQPYAPKLPNIKTLTYEPARTPSAHTHHYIRPAEGHILNGQAVAKVLLAVKKSGFVPDIVLVHTGWGEGLFVKDVFPETKLIGFLEFYYHAKGADTSFDPEFPQTFDDQLRIRSKNITHLLSLEAVDAGVCPTVWQKSTHPKVFQHKLHLIHEGINTEAARPNPQASIQLANGQVLTRNDEVVTYVGRNLEPYRGFHIVMRAIEKICERRPNATILIIGGDDISYGKKLPAGETWRQKMLQEVKIDPNRVHFLGRLAYQDYLSVLQVSSAHIYLTVPFVLSWSMMEAMSMECPLIGSKTEPVMELLKHGKNGLLVDFLSPTEVADAVDTLLDDRELGKKLGRAARKTIVESYTIEKGIQQYMMLFKSLLAPRKKK